MGAGIAATATVAGRTIRFATDALTRWGVEIRPALEGSALVEDLVRTVENVGAIVGERPAWLEHGDLPDPDRGWLLVGDDIAFPLRRGDIAVTCIPRGTYAPVMREERRSFKRSRRTARAAARKGLKSDRVSKRKRLEEVV